MTVEHKIDQKEQNCSQYKTKKIKVGQQFANISNNSKVAKLEWHLKKLLKLFASIKKMTLK